MALVFTADQHFGHRNIINYAGRPFTDVERMNEYLVALWNSEVAPEDEAWFLGDVVLGRRDEGLQIIPTLNGHKVLLPGNHDRCWPGHKKWQRERQRYLDGGFEAILDGDQTMTIAGQDVTISHFPYRWTGDHEGVEERYVEHKPIDDGGWLLHGHVHERWRIRGRQINVGVDAWAGQPVHLDQVEHYLTEPHPHDRDPYQWPRSAGLTEDGYVVDAEHVRSVTRKQLRSAFGIPDEV